jgi:hypothetical protein
MASRLRRLLLAMETNEAALLRRQSRELDFALWIEYRGDWPLLDVFSTQGGNRSIGWLMGELWNETDGARCPFWGDLMPETTCEALNLPQSPDGLTYSYGLRLIRRNLNWIAHLAG